MKEGNARSQPALSSEVKQTFCEEKGGRGGPWRAWGEGQRRSSHREESSPT